MKPLRLCLSIVVSFLTFFVMASVPAQSMADFREDGSSGSCGWAKSDSRGNTLPISIYAKPNDANPLRTINKDNNFYWVVEKQGNWVKLRGTGGEFLKGPFIGWVKLQQLQLGAFRNCN
jgi:hypothetical protein